MSLQRREEHLDEETLSDAGATAEGGSYVANCVSYGDMTVSSRAILTVYPVLELE
jgi:hypothetical protein